MAFTTKTLGFIVWLRPMNGMPLKGKCFPSKIPFPVVSPPSFTLLPLNTNKWRGTLVTLLKIPTHHTPPKHHHSTSSSSLMMILHTFLTRISSPSQHAHTIPHLTTPPTKPPTHISQLTHHQKYHQQQGLFKQTFINSSPPSPSP